MRVLFYLPRFGEPQCRNWRPSSCSKLGLGRSVPPAPLRRAERAIEPDRCGCVYSDESNSRRLPAQTPPGCASADDVTQLLSEHQNAVRPPTIRSFDIIAGPGLIWRLVRQNSVQRIPGQTRMDPLIETCSGLLQRKTGAAAACRRYSRGHAGREERPTLSTGEFLILRLLPAISPFLFFLGPLGLCLIPLFQCPFGDIVDLGRR